MTAYLVVAAVVAIVFLLAVFFRGASGETETDPTEAASVDPDSDASSDPAPEDDVDSAEEKDASDPGEQGRSGEAIELAEPGAAELNAPEADETDATAGEEGPDSTTDDRSGGAEPEPAARAVAESPAIAAVRDVRHRELSPDRQPAEPGAPATAAGGNGFIPEEEKGFLFDPGDVLLREGGKDYSLIKVLAVERVDVTAGDRLRIADQLVEAPSADHFLVVSVTLSDEYTSETQALEALAAGDWAKVVHAPMRPSGLGRDELKKIGSKRVTDEEKKLVEDWRREFEGGRGGVW